MIGSNCWSLLTGLIAKMLVAVAWSAEVTTPRTYVFFIRALTRQRV
jgi:hypothetical protein